MTGWYIGSRADWRRPRVALLTAATVLLTTSLAEAQLRIVTYNTTRGPYTTADVATILKSIGEETGNNGKAGAALLTDGIAKPIDILLLQEQNNPSPGGLPANASPETQAFLNILNNTIYNTTPGVTYAMSNRTGAGDTTQTMIYRTQTVQLISDAAIGTTSITGAPRQPTQFQVRPVGYGSNSDLYIYNSHYKASQGTDSGASTSNADRRNNEAIMLRTSTNSLPEGTNIIAVGDHNFYDFDAQEPAWATLTAAGAGQLNDPINQVGTWHNNSSFAAVHTQAPCVSQNVGNCGSGGGMDDRFDFQLVSGELQDGHGLSIISNSYHTFGNNGTTFNLDINSASNTVTFPGISSYTKTQILNSLHVETDHLPVVADYQVPAIMQATAGTIPTSIDLGSVFNLGVTVNNSANVVAANGADVLHYSLSATGSATGSFTNQSDAALGSSNMHTFALNTSSIGMKSATITALSTDQGIPNGTINIPISFLVVLPGDYNSDGVVDAQDYDVWRKNSGLMGGATYAKGDGDRDGNVTASDYAIWRAHFGQTASGAGSGALTAVPEPGTLSLLVIGICLLRGRPTKLKA